MAKKVQHEAPIPTTEEHARQFSTRSKTLDPRGREIVSPTPLEPPLNYTKQESLSMQIRRMVQSEALRMAAENAGMETFEESEDFDVGDDYEPHSPWENEFDPPISELTQAGQQILSEREAAAAAAKAPEAPLTPLAKPGATDGAEGGTQ